MYADGRHCLQPKKTTEIYNTKSTNQSSSYAGKPAGFILTKIAAAIKISLAQNASDGVGLFFKW